MTEAPRPPEPVRPATGPWVGHASRRELLAAGLILLAILGVVVCMLGLALGLVRALASSSLTAYPAMGAYGRFQIDQMVRLGVYTMATGATFTILGYLGLRALEPSDRGVRERRGRGHRRVFAILAALLAAVLLVSAATFAFLPPPQTTTSLTDADFPTYSPAAFNFTYRYSVPIREEAGLFLDGELHIRWNVTPAYELVATAWIMKLDENGTPKLPADLLTNEYQVPQTGAYIVIIPVAPCPFDLRYRSCDGFNSSRAQVYGTLTATDPNAFPPVQLALGLGGVAALTVAIVMFFVRPHDLESAGGSARKPV